MVRLATPLSTHAVLRTRDIDEARASVAASLAPHRLTKVGSGHFEVVHNVARLGGLGIHYIDYGTEFEVRADVLGFHLIQIPLAGSTRLVTGRREVVASPTIAAMTGPGSVEMRYSDGNPRLMVQMAPTALCDRLEVARRAGLIVPPPVGATVDIARGSGRTWRSLLDVMIADLERESSLAKVSLAAGSLELAVIDGFIATLAEQGSLPVPARTPHERLIKRAARLIDDHCAEPLGTLDIADAIGLSVRALQAGFREHLNTTPMGHLRQARLVRMRDALRDGSATSVTEAAARWGLTHLGRVSADYRASFGESPRDTLQRSR